MSRTPVVTEERHNVEGIEVRVREVRLHLPGCPTLACPPIPDAPCTCDERNSQVTQPK